MIVYTCVYAGSDIIILCQHVLECADETLSLHNYNYYVNVDTEAFTD